jgi:hypothetical protein
MCTCTLRDIRRSLQRRSCFASSDMSCTGRRWRQHDPLKRWYPPQHHTEDLHLNLLGSSWCPSSYVIRWIWMDVESTNQPTNQPPAVFVTSPVNCCRHHTERFVVSLQSALTKAEYLLEICRYTDWAGLSRSVL